MITLTSTAFDPAERLRRFSGSAGGASDDVGGVVSFIGVCRGEPGLVALELEAYPGFTETEIAREADAAMQRFGASALDVVHRVGRVAPGEAIVFVAAAARHRRAAFQAVDRLMDFLKSRAPFWKKEIALSGERWIEPRPQDYEDAARWDAQEACAVSDATQATGAMLTPGGRIEADREFKPVRIAVLTVSDTRDLAGDTSGDILAARVAGAGHALAGRALVRDEVDAIREQVLSWVESREVDAVITTGGTGLTGRDVTPQALEPLFDKRMEGFSVVFHLVSYGTIGLSTLQSRATAGLIDGVFVFCLPGSNGAVKDGWGVIGPQLDSRHAPCNMVELMPRLRET